MPRQIDRKYKDLLLPYDRLRALKESLETLPHSTSAMTAEAELAKVSLPRSRKR